MLAFCYAKDTMNKVLLALCCVTCKAESIDQLAHLKSLHYGSRQKLAKHIILASFSSFTAASVCVGFWLTRYNFNYMQSDKLSYQPLLIIAVGLLLGAGLALQHYTHYKLPGKFLEFSAYGLIAGILLYTAIYKKPMMQNPAHVGSMTSSENTDSPSTTPGSSVHNRIANTANNRTTTIGNTANKRQPLSRTNRQTASAVV